MTRILLLEDEPQLRRLIKDVLEAEGFEVTDAGDGRILRGGDVLQNIDVVVTDIMMPDCDGLEVVKTVRAKATKAKIIVMSGGGRTVSKDFLPLAGKLGADRTLYKPFSPFDLVGEIKAVLAETRPS